MGWFLCAVDLTIGGLPYVCVWDYIQPSIIRRRITRRHFSVRLIPSHRIPYDLLIRLQPEKAVVPHFYPYTLDPSCGRTAGEEGRTPARQARVVTTGDLSFLHARSRRTRKPGWLTPAVFATRLPLFGDGNEGRQNSPHRCWRHRNARSIR